MWKPTPEHPLPVSFVMLYKNSGKLGLNNILWAIVKASNDGCTMNEEHQKVRMGSLNKTAPFGFGVVILPPLRAELGFSQKVKMHQYSEIFDLEHQQHFFMKHRNCYITDKVNFDRLRKDGSLQMLEDAVSGSRWHSKSAISGPQQHRIYQGLELSKRLFEQVYEPCVSKMRRTFQRGESFYAAVHMRVEDDWAEHCQRHHAGKGRCIFGADEIANITLATEEIHGHHNFLLLYAADMFDPMNIYRTSDSMRTDPTKVWPPHVKTVNPAHLGCFDQDQLSYTERSAVSMFLAADADTYVGTTGSTFFKGVAMIRELSRPFTGHTYAYNGDSPEYKHALQYHPATPYSPWPEDGADGHTYG